MYPLSFAPSPKSPFWGDVGIKKWSQFFVFRHLKSSLVMEAVDQNDEQSSRRLVARIKQLQGSSRTTRTGRTSTIKCTTKLSKRSKEHLLERRSLSRCVNSLCTTIDWDFFYGMFNKYTCFELA